MCEGSGRDGLLPCLRSGRTNLRQQVRQEQVHGVRRTPGEVRRADDGNVGPPGCGDRVWTVMSQLALARATDPPQPCESRAGDGNRTRVLSLESPSGTDQGPAVDLESPAESPFAVKSWCFVDVPCYPSLGARNRAKWCRGTLGTEPRRGGTFPKRVNPRTRFSKR